MIDSIEEYEKFLSDNKDDDLILNLVLTDDRNHPSVELPSLLFIKNCRTKKSYSLTINHQDIQKVKSLSEITLDISKFKGSFYVIDKKKFLQHFTIPNNIFDINLVCHLTDNKIIDIVEYDTNAHKFIKQYMGQYHMQNNIIPYVKHKEVSDLLFDKIEKIILNDKSIFGDQVYLRINNEIIPILSELESNGICVDKDLFYKHFETKTHDGIVYSQYNIYTSTGRPSNRFGGINYAALQKDNGSRSCFISRFGEEGMMMLVDYSAFHPRIICELTDFELPKGLDFYYYIAQLCLKKDEIEKEEISEVKRLTFKQLYGGVEEEYSHIRFFHNLKGFVNFHWKEYQDKGFTYTPIFKRKVRGVIDPNPSKIFNYILQATETELVVPIIGKINDFLRNKKSKAILYTYDSLLFDINKNELDTIKNDIINIMTCQNRFPVKCYIGKSYAELNQISL
jgi:hypothetical protein